MRVIRILLIVALLACAGAGSAQERVVFSGPVKTDAGAVEFRVSELVLNVEARVVTIRLREASNGAFVSNGRQVITSYTEAEADTLLRALNTADLTTKSLQRRVIEKLVADGKVPTGLISGVPQ